MNAAIPESTTANNATTRRAGRSGSLLLAVCALLLMMMVGACANIGSKLLGKRDIQISQVQLLEQMLKFQPEHMQWLNRLNVDLSPPRLELDAGSNRIVTEWDLELKKGLLTKLLKQQPFRQTVAVSTRLAFNPDNNSIVLKGVRLNSDVVAVLGSRLSPEYGDYISQFLNLAIEQGLENYPVYTFNKDQLRHAGVNWKVEGITVQEQGLSVSVAPGR